MVQYFVVSFIVSILILRVQSFSIDFDDHVIAKRQANYVRPHIYDMSVLAHIKNRYAETFIISRVRNSVNVAMETTFSVVLPETGFITGLVLEVNGKNYTGQIKDRNEAEKQYKEMTAQGLAAAQVVHARHANRFTIYLNLHAAGLVTFYLSYEELLNRRFVYEYVLNVFPMTLVPELKIVVKIDESLPISWLNTPSMTGRNLKRFVERISSDISDIQRTGKNSAIVSFFPDYESQRWLAIQLGSSEEEGIAGQYVVEYDVEVPTDSSEVLINDGYFVHFFYPSKLPNLPKHVVFVLDISGSMYYAVSNVTRLQKLQSAMNHILDDLKAGDLFNIVSFNHFAMVWNINTGRPLTVRFDKNFNILRNMKGFPVNSENIPKTKTVINNFRPGGATNIELALETGLYLTRQQTKSLPIIVFLSDGEATAGRYKDVDSWIQGKNQGGVPIFGLSFGEEADREMVTRISMKNNGFARHIYDDSDASIQLTNFYEEISSPSLINVKFQYLLGISDATSNNFKLLFSGQQAVAAGKLGSTSFSQPPTVTGTNHQGRKTFSSTVQRAVGNLERLWAYLTIKELLRNLELNPNLPVIRQKALALALKYNFVTPLTTMIVVTPEISQRMGFSRADDFIGFMLTTRSFEEGIPEEDLREGRTSLLNELLVDITGLDWIGGLFDEETSSLLLKDGNYKLSRNYTNYISFPCPKTILGKSGKCKPILNCPISHKYVKNVTVFTNYFCNLNGYAGICCPEAEVWGWR